MLMPPITQALTTSSTIEGLARLDDAEARRPVSMIAAIPAISPAKHIAQRDDPLRRGCAPPSRRAD